MDNVFGFKNHSFAETFQFENIINYPLYDYPLNYL
jgi:hypothetical protein